MTWENLKLPLTVYKNIINETNIFVIYFITGKRKLKNKQKVIFYNGYVIDLTKKEIKPHKALLAYDYQQFYDYILDEKNILSHEIITKLFNKIFKDK